MKKVAILISLIVSFSFAQPTVTVQDPTDVSSTSAKLKAKVNLPNGWTQVYNVKVYIHLTNKSTNSTTEAYTKTYTSGNWGGEYSFSKTVTDLSKGTNYEYYASATEANFGTVYSTSGTKAFTTPTDTLKVPSAYSTIQAGLNAATSGDVVLVSAGTYTENIIWPDVNGIKLISVGDSSNTIIDGGGTSSVIYMNPSSATIDTTTLIQGFKITNGGGIRFGGGIYLKKVNPLIKSLIITGNNTSYSGNTTHGGGLYILDCSPVIVNCSITQNNADNGGGVKIAEYDINSEPIFRNTTISNNNAKMSGGGIAMDSTPTTTLINVTVSSNISKGNVGGMYAFGKTIFKNVLVINNVVEGYEGHSGGVFFSFQADLSEIEKLVVSNNSASLGGGIYYSGEGKLTNITISYNQSEYGAAWIGGNTNIEKVSIYGNLGQNGGFYNASTGNNSSVGPNIINSNIISNGIGVKNNAQGITADAINNYWGDSSGPYHPTQNASGKGDSVNAFVNIDPWLTAPNTDAPPIPAQNLTLTASAATSASFSWDASKMGDIAGYKFYYDTDSSGYPYANSVDLGNVVTKSLTGLTTGKTYYVAVTTYDTDGNESWYSKEVAVQLNNKPVIAAVSDVTINEDESSTVTLSATDADGDALTYSAVSDTNAVTISVSTSTLTLTPNANWHGVATIKAYASDGYSKDSTSFKLTVTPVNDAPIISAVPDNSTNEETEKAIVVGASDVDGDALTYTASSDTSAVVITVSSDTLKLMPATNYTGTAKITVVVSDNALKDTTSFNFKVININDAPVIAAVSDVTINEDNVSAVTLSATDIDGDAITYSAVSDTNAVTTSVSSSTLTLTPNSNWHGVANIKAYASDGSLKDSTSFKLTVTSVNDAPTLTAITETLSTDEETVLKVAFKGEDVDGDDLTYAYASDTSGVAATHNTAKDSLVLTPVTDFFGNAIITVSVSDGSLSDTSSFTLNVININDAPVLSGIQNQNINEDEVIVVKLTATDLDGDALSYSGIADTSAVTVTASNDTLKLTPKADWNGTSVITAIVSDGTISDSTSFTLNVNPVQDVPYAFDWVSPNERDTINVDKNNTATEYVFKWNSSKDVDGDALTYHFYVADSLIEVLSDTTTVGTYQDFLDHWPLQFQMLPRMTFTFNVWVHDGTDSVKVTGEPRKVFVNRYENLSTEGEGIPTEFALHENYPNPFNPTTTLRFDLPEVSSITLTIYNMLGQRVRTFNMNDTPAGYHSVTWNATNDYGDPVGAGVYLYQLRANQFVKTRKMVLLK
ncbi:MAG: tandem-95 repeat protein [Candidatus Marinimicrobia bacterium]|nr:tandem-95 repeat protein [Candidatus Neomarinimicrobiota bacterium]